MRILDAPPSSFSRASSESDGAFSPQPGLTRFAGGPAPLPPLVLIVDDDDDSRAILRIILENARFRVAEAATGFEGLHAAGELHPDVILLDMILPGLDGWETARRLRRDESTRGAIIIVVTALASTDDHDRARAAGCDDVLTKPAPPSLILRTVRQYLGRSADWVARVEPSRPVRAIDATADGP